MLREIDQFYLKQEEPLKSCFIVLRTIIQEIDENLTEEWKYKLPFFYYKGKMFCYLWKDKKTNEPYIGIVEGMRIDHPKLEQGDRKRMKILRINPNEDIPIRDINEVLLKALEFY